MKSKQTIPIPLKLRVLTTGLALTLAGGLTAHAHPYASNITPTNGLGQVFFTMNETGAVVTVTFEDNSVLNMGILDQGTTNFSLVGHSSFRISCTKAGTASPSLISSDAVTYANWPNPSGVAVNQNPKIGTLFGRVYANNNIAGSGKSVGIYAMNSDLSFVTSAGQPTPNTWAGSINSNFKSPGRMRVTSDGTLLVADGKGAGGAAQVYMYQPDLSSWQVLLGPSTASGAGDVFGTPVATGSLAAGNFRLYVPSAGTPTPADTNCIYGPLTFQGSFNCVQVYNIGSGPLPWNKRPDYSYTVGLDGISQLRPEVDVEPDGKVVAAFGRSNLSNPNIQILRPILTTNGITGDPINKAIADAAKDQTNWLYTSGVNPPFNQPPTSDPWNGSSIPPASGAIGTYAGVRVSPDGRFLASVDVNNGVTLAFLNNGIPNDSTIFGISNTPAIGNARGMDFDAADNLWVISSGQGLLRCYSLGLSSTCVSSNDWTGTNGTFNFSIPGVQATLAVANPVASQHYVNNTVNPGTPISGVFRISLNTADLTSTGPLTINFALSGSAVYTNNYTINTNETPNGVTVNRTSVTFPGTVFSGSNGPNWNVDVKITPTRLPVSGPTMNVTMRVQNGNAYTAVSPLSGTLAIINTGPQLLQLAAPSPSTLNGMNRGIPSDQARFNITRLGDTNGPGNDALSIVPKTYTVTNFIYAAPAGGVNLQAKLGTDYTAAPQNFAGSAPVDSSSASIIINPGDTTVACMIGNPVQHANTTLTRTNLSVILNLTNACGSAASCSTNCTSAEGLPYQVTKGTQTLNEFDNANGGEVVLWSNPLTNAADSKNWTLVFASTLQGDSPTLPQVISNYDNTAVGPGLNGSGNDQYVAWFGKQVNDPSNDGGITVPPSPAMNANGWNTALKLTVNKNPTLLGESGINLYPQVPGQPWSNHMVFNGNYALRFDMYLSLLDYALNNPTIGTVAREFAAFGINHRGTNANWRLDNNPRAAGTGAFPINADGEWCCIGACSGSVTPADYDMFVSPPWALVDANGAPVSQPIPYTTNFFVNQIASPSFAPYTNAYVQAGGAYTGVTNIFANAGVPNDNQSANNAALPSSPSPQQGVIKFPPFLGQSTRGGAPDNAWVDVSLEMTRQTNLTLKVAQQQIFTSSILNPVFGTANPLAPYGGTPMLGYLDPHLDIGDYSPFVYFSNLRVVELSPFIPWTNQIYGMIVTQGSSFSLTAGAMYASNPLTNVWYYGTTNGTLTAGSLENGTPTTPIITNTYADTKGLYTFSVSNIQTPTNILSVWSDQAGAVTNYLVCVDIIDPTPVTTPVALNKTGTLGVNLIGNARPTFQWMRSGTNLVNGTQTGRLSSFGNVTGQTLFITNAQPEDLTVYSNIINYCFSTWVYTNTAVLANPATSVVVAPPSQTSLWGSSAQFTVTASGSTPFTYQWKKGGVNLANGGHIAGATTSALTINPVTTADAGTYTAGVTNIAGGDISSPGILQVVVPPPTITNTLVAGGNITLRFSSTNGFDTTNAFVLQTSPLVQGPYTNVPGAVFNGSSGSFNVVVPQGSEDKRFYRLQHASP